MSARDKVGGAVSGLEYTKRAIRPGCEAVRAALPDRGCRGRSLVYLSAQNGSQGLTASRAGGRQLLIELTRAGAPSRVLFAEGFSHTEIKAARAQAAAERLGGAADG